MTCCFDACFDHLAAGTGDHISDFWKRPIPTSPSGMRARYYPYSTVTDFARLRGWSTSVPITTAVW
jgi:hypothetical protein